MKRELFNAAGLAGHEEAFKRIFYSRLDLCKHVQLQEYNAVLIYFRKRTHAGQLSNLGDGSMKSRIFSDKFNLNYLMKNVLKHRTLMNRILYEKCAIIPCWKIFLLSISTGYYHDWR